VLGLGSAWLGSTRAHHRLRVFLAAAGLLVGQTRGRVVLDRPAVVNMATQVESYARAAGAAWVGDMAHVGELLQHDPSSWAAGFEDEPYRYWRACRMEGGAAGGGLAVPQELVQDIVRNARLPPRTEALALPMHTLRAPVQLCSNASAAAEPLCREHFLDAKECRALASLIEARRDALRRRAPPVYAVLEAGRVGAVYRVGEDPVEVARAACGAAKVAVGAMEGCVQELVQVIEAKLQLELRYQRLCGVQVR
jgi:hypothetical protein